jgi:predicted TIM-barrel fold metal-dependent hydrolase
VFKVARENKSLLPGPSINPYRSNAVELLDECFERKAVLIKWLPSTQRIDPADPALTPFYRRAAELGIPLLVHIGGERTFESLNPEFNFLHRLDTALEMGVKIICAHSATPILASGEPSQLGELEVYLKRYPHLWVDNSGMCNPGRFNHTHALANHPLIAQRTLYGSDWPVPSNAFYFLPKLGVRKVWKLDRIKNYFQRDFAIKQALGYPSGSATLAHKVLANLEHWVGSDTNSSS